MLEFGGFKPSGRQYAGPASDLVELVADSGLKHTAIVFKEKFREHEALHLDVELIRSFLEHQSL